MCSASHFGMNSGSHLVLLQDPDLHIGQVTTWKSTTFCLYKGNKGNKEIKEIKKVEACYYTEAFSPWFAITVSQEDSSQSLASCLNLLPSPLEVSTDRTPGREPREPPIRYRFLTGASLWTFQFHRHNVNMNASKGGIM